MNPTSLATSAFLAGVNRRRFLQMGAIGLGGLALPDLLRARALAGATTKPRAVIMVVLPGGPSHLDTYDLKPEAPTDIRGEFQPIKSNVPGFDLCEYMPLQAKIADKLALVRSLQFVEPMQHELEEVYTGFPKSFHRPSFGSMISRFGGGDPRLPSYVSLEYSERVVPYESPQYVGAAHAPLHISGMAGVRNLSLNREVKPDRFATRRALLESLDSFRRDMDRYRDLDAFTARAVDILSSPQARDAFDLEKEPQKIRERYPRSNEPYIYVGKENDSVWDGQKFLLARRLVEAGVPVVTLRMGSWDHHGNVIQSQGGLSIFHSLRTALPLLDRSLYALITDLYERGLDKEVLVVVWGEFGRTPRISLTGRDHWPDASFALFSGAVRTGQVVGETDSRGERPRNRPLGPQNVLGTIYHTLGINWKQSVLDFNGRPTPLLDSGAPIAELVS